MKKRLLAIAMMVATSVCLTACWSEAAVEVEDGSVNMASGDTAGTEVSTEVDVDSEVTQDVDGTYVKPLAFVFDLANPTDATLYSSFNATDIDLEDGEITFKAYSMDLYDSAQISMLQMGDTLLYDGQEIIVETIEDKSGDLYINGGLDGGGCVLVSNEGGTYVARKENDAATYSEIGTLTLPISESTHIKDSYSDPNSPKEVAYDEIQSYLDKLDGGATMYTFFSTTIEISGGKVVGIERAWTP